MAVLYKICLYLEANSFLKYDLGWLAVQVLKLEAFKVVVERRESSQSEDVALREIVSSSVFVKAYPFIPPTIFEQILERVDGLRSARAKLKRR